MKDTARSFLDGVREREAADERLHFGNRVFSLVKPEWHPIETAPVPSHADLGRGRWECLLQDKKGTVISGYAAYARTKGVSERRERSRKATPIYQLRWYAGSNNIHALNRLFPAIYWMPLPAPRVVS